MLLMIVVRMFNSTLFFWDEDVMKLGQTSPSFCADDFLRGGSAQFVLHKNPIDPDLQELVISGAAWERFMGR